MLESPIPRAYPWAAFPSLALGKGWERASQGGRRAFSRAGSYPDALKKLSGLLHEIVSS